MAKKINSRPRILNSSGFTLIEILIVVAIIGILSSVVLVGLGPVQRRGRDARRLADLKEVQTALELYYNKCGYYPGSAQSGTPCSDFTQIKGGSGSWDAMSDALKNSNLGTRQIPSDPSYEYGSSGDGSEYVLKAILEDDSNPALSNSPKQTVNGVDCAVKKAYCVEF